MLIKWGSTVLRKHTCFHEVPLYLINIDAICIKTINLKEASNEVMSKLCTYLEGASKIFCTYLLPCFLLENMKKNSFSNL
jgi:hypothetical protein